MANRISGLNVGLAVESPLGTSLLPERGTAHWHAATERDREAVRRAAEVCRENGVTQCVSIHTNIFGITAQLSMFG